MKRRALKIAAAVAVVSITLCGSKSASREESAVKTISVDFSKMKNSEKEKGLFSSCKIVPLETNDSCLIGRINKVILWQDRIFILDHYQTASVFIFDGSGKWINTISRRGQGPDDYADLTDMFFDEQEQLLYLVCRFNQKLMLFDKNGQLQKQEKLPGIRLWYMEKTPEGYVACANNASTPPSYNSNIYTLSSDLKIQSRHFEIPKEWEYNSLGSSTMFAKYKSDVYYFPPLNNTVYRISNNSVSEFYKYDFGKYNFPEAWKSVEYIFDSKRDVQALNRYVQGLKYFAETDNNIYSIVLFEGSYKLVTYSKKDETVRATLLLDNPFINTKFGDVCALTATCIVAEKDASIIMYAMELAKENNDRKTLDILKAAIPGDIRDDDNQVLFIYYF
jgi:hypothetical protein